jgi:RNA polymerase sigma factor (sigma-70 family)
MALGDETALGRLSVRCTARALSIATSILRRSDLAEDVVAEAFEQAWRDASRFDPARGSAMAWFLTIARSRSLDSRRRIAALARREVVVEVHELEAAADADEDTPERACELSQRGCKLRAMLAALTPAHRQALSLAFRRGLTHAEIARHCGLPLGTVKSHVKRGLETMREQCIAAGIVP